MLHRAQPEACACPFRDERGLQVPLQAAMELRSSQESRVNNPEKS